MKEAEHDLYDTAVLTDLGIKLDSIPSPDPMDLGNNETAYKMLLNLVKTRDNSYQQARESAEYYRRKSEDRKTATIVSAIAEILVALGTGGLFADYSIIALPIILLVLGILLTAWSLYLNFRKAN